ncbi:MAG: hypothetical protein U0T73_10340 [Chitinophagales bacterium]
MPNAKFIGSFYYKRTETGNLIGAYNNNKTTEILPEFATPTEPVSGFEGRYVSNWMDGENRTATLEITREDQRFHIRWRNTRPQPYDYEGWGFIVDSMLIGCYYNLPAAD